MITHECIKCGDIQLIPCAKKCPVFQKYKCPKCGETQWIKHSRINPETFSKDMIRVNEKTKSVEILNN